MEAADCAFSPRLDEICARWPSEIVPVVEDLDLGDDTIIHDSEDSDPHAPIEVRWAEVETPAHVDLAWVSNSLDAPVWQSVWLLPERGSAFDGWVVGARTRTDGDITTVWLRIETRPPKDERVVALTSGDLPQSWAEPTHAHDGLIAMRDIDGDGRVDRMTELGGRLVVSDLENRPLLTRFVGR